MTLYDVLLFGHITAVVVWLGSGFLLQVLAAMTLRANDDRTFARLWELSARLGNVLFIPASLVTLALGIALVVDGPWTFGQLWVVLGLAGFAAGLVTGITVFKPGGERVAAMIEANGGEMSAEAMADARRQLVIGRIDFVVLALVVFDMTVKPVGGDTGTLALMATVLVAGVAFFLHQARSAPTAAPEPVAPTRLA